MADGAQNRRRGRDQAGLAYALGAEGAQWLRVLDDDDLDLGHVADGGDQVVVQVLGSAGQVFLHQREPDALGDAALDLPLHLGRVDGAADIVGGMDADGRHGPELSVHVDERDLRAEGVGRVRRALALGVECRGRWIEAADTLQHHARRVGL